MNDFTHLDEAGNLYIHIRDLVYVQGLPDLLTDNGGLSFLPHS